jgi:hypothetical protein
MCIDQQEITYIGKYFPPTDTVSNGYGHIQALDTLVSLGSASLRQVSGHEFQKSQSACLTVSTEVTLIFILILISISIGLESVKPVIMCVCVCVSLPIVRAASICALVILCGFRWLSGWQVA